MESKNIPLVVTTESRGVFFGYGQVTTKKEIRLEQARMCVYWDKVIRGVLGLAAAGPNNNCRISYAIPAITLQKVTAIMECTPEATENWEVGPWKL